MIASHLVRFECVLNVGYYYFVSLLSHTHSHTLYVQYLYVTYDCYNCAWLHVAPHVHVHHFLFVFLFSVPPSLSLTSFSLSYFLLSLSPFSYINISSPSLFSCTGNEHYSMVISCYRVCQWRRDFRLVRVCVCVLHWRVFYASLHQFSWAKPINNQIMVHLHGKYCIRFCKALTKF